MNKEEQIIKLAKQLNEIDKQEDALNNERQEIQNLIDNAIFDFKKINGDISDINEPIEYLRRKLGTLEENWLSEIEVKKRELVKEKVEIESELYNLKNQIN